MSIIEIDELDNCLISRRRPGRPKIIKNLALTRDIKMSLPLIVQNASSAISTFLETSDFPVLCGNGPLTARVLSNAKEILSAQKNYIHELSAYEINILRQHCQLSSTWTRVFL